MGKARRRHLVVTATAALILAGCSTTSSRSDANPTGHTYTIGLLADLTGPAGGDERTVVLGARAAIGLAARDGYHLKYVLADTGLSPAGVLAAAQRLVDQDHVFAVVAVSALSFAAAPWLTRRGVPVIGAAIDSTEWQTAPNMFSISPITDLTKVLSNIGLLFKQLGATNIASVGYGVAPSSAEGAKGAAVSAEVAGLKVGYLNANVPFGSTNVGPMALAMKAAKVDGFIGSILPSTGFAAVQAARQLGVNLKVVLNASGYGGDLILGGQDAQLLAQGMYFYSTFEPVELHTPATVRFQNALSTYANVTTDPTFDEYAGYLAVDGLVMGLKAAGPDPDRAKLINAMLGITKYDGAGLLSTHTISFALGQRIQTTVCIWTTRYSGAVFQPIPGASPLCGTIVPGKSVSASS
jgi:branched-chain amino acid transport system substrate-binding protein